MRRHLGRAMIGIVVAIVVIVGAVVGARYAMSPQRPTGAVQNVSYVQATDPGDKTVNARSCPSQPNKGVTSGECGTLFQIPNGTKVQMRCWESGNSPEGFKTKKWFYVTTVNGPDPGASGFVFSEFVHNQTSTPECTQAITDHYKMGAPGTIVLAQGSAAKIGYYYDVTLQGFPANVDIAVTCYDSVSQQGFKTFSMHIAGDGGGRSQSGCFSGDGPDHWVVVENTWSNTVSWTSTTSSGSTPANPTSSAAISIARGPGAKAGYWYVITLRGFPPNSPVSATCYDSVSTGGFRTFSMSTDGSGTASTQSNCYSGDGPDHWVRAGGVESNHVSWTWRASTGTGSGSGTTSPPSASPVFTVMNTSETPPDGVWFRNSPYTADTSRTTGLGVYVNERVQLLCYAFGDSVGPYNDSLWYHVTNVTRPTVNGQPNSGYLNAHYINDGKVANQVDGGIPAC